MKGLCLDFLAQNAASALPVINGVLNVNKHLLFFHSFARDLLMLECQV